MAKQLSKIIQHQLEVVLFRMFQWGVRFYPQNVLNVLGSMVGWICFSVLRIRRSVTLDNLAGAFPEKSQKERKRIAIGSYQHAAHLLLEFLRLPYLSKEMLIRRSSLLHADQFQNAMDKKKGCILLSAHFGNWEWYGALLNQLGYPVSYLVKKQHNPKSDKVLNDIRRSKGGEIIYLGLAVRAVLKALRANRFVAIIGDQDAGRSGEFVNFFGRPASTAVGAASLAFKTGASVVFGYAIRKPNGDYECFSQPIDLNQFQGTESEKIKQFLQLYMQQLESAIREYSEQYFWMHKRWRTKPAMEENV